MATKHRFAYLFSSDLQRAYKTAIAVQRAQLEENNLTVPLYQLKVLQEQNFGTFERMTFAARAKAAADSADDLQLPETKEAMMTRANEFLNDHLIPLLVSETTDEVLQVAVVSHGLILSTLWRCLLRRFAPSMVAIGRGVEIPAKDMLSLEHLGAWGNTGYLELDITLIDSSPDIVSKAQTSVSSNYAASSGAHSSILNRYKMTIVVVNSREHLQRLKRTGGGVGSSKHDDKQKHLESFFKKRRVG